MRCTECLSSSKKRLAKKQTFLDIKFFADFRILQKARHKKTVVNDGWTIDYKYKHMNSVRSE